MTQHERHQDDAEKAIKDMAAQYAAIKEECEGWKHACGELEEMIDDLRDTINGLQYDLKVEKNRS